MMTFRASLCSNTIFYLVILAICCILVQDDSLASAMPQQSDTEITNSAMKRLNSCERAVWSCCQSDRQTFQLPIRCFERNDCTGLHWISDDPCSKKYRDSIEEKIREEKDKLKEESENVNDDKDYSF